MQRAYERQIRESKSLLAGYDSGIKAAPDEKTENALHVDIKDNAVKLIPLIHQLLILFE